ncbi:MAG: DUF2442 domain-containing protein [Rhodocyclaceae bacterium]|nr:DUF2442 domain-containing protein [Rhodocyclaceae bacterium]
MGSYHKVENVRIEKGLLCLVADGVVIRKPLSELSVSLAEATREEVIAFEVSPSGYGIHWPLLDEDVSIDGLLGLVHAPQHRQKSA